MTDYLRKTKAQLIELLEDRPAASVCVDSCNFTSGPGVDGAKSAIALAEAAAENAKAIHAIALSLKGGNGPMMHIGEFQP